MVTAINYKCCIAPLIKQVGGLGNVGLKNHSSNFGLCEILLLVSPPLKDEIQLRNTSKINETFSELIRVAYAQLSITTT